jgi:tRNA A-37 threonylcarbamoyl transferase component Bud32
MKEIDFLIDKSTKYKKSIIQKKFFSKKNSVAYVLYDNKPRILKWYPPGLIKQLNTEFKVLNEGFNKLNIPIVYEKDTINNVIIMNYIPGRNLCDIINDENVNTTDKQNIILKLSEWFKKFHDFYKSNDNSYIRGDSVLRNFIYTDEIWGLDFEEFRIGKVEEDVADLCASILTTDPQYTKEKFNLCRLFIEYYSKNLLINYKGLMKELTSSIIYRLINKGISYSKKDVDYISSKIFLNI